MITTAIIVNVLLQFLIGSVYYGYLYREQWLAAANLKSPEQVMEILKGFEYVYSFPLIFSLTQTLFLNAIMQKTGETSILSGLKWGILTWLFLLAPCVLHHDAFRGQITLGFIDTVKDLGCCLCTGVILAVFSGKKAVKSGKKNH